MSLFGLTFLIIIIFLIIYLIYSTIWGKPISIKLFFNRALLKITFGNPEVLTYVGLLEKFGYHKHNGKLNNASEKFEDKEYKIFKKQLRILYKYKKEKLSDKDKISYDVMDSFLQNILDNEKFRYCSYPVNQMFGAQSELPNFMMTVHPLISKIEAKNYIRRLKRFKIKFVQILEGLKIREEIKAYPPKFMIKRVITEMNEFIKPFPKDNPLYKVFIEKTKDYKFCEKLAPKVEEAINIYVYPAYKMLIDYFKHLDDVVKESNGVWSLPNGEEYYKKCLKEHTTTNYTPEEIYNIGIKEVNRIENQMREVLHKLGKQNIENPTMTIAEIGKQDKFKYPNTKEGKKRCIADYSKFLNEITSKLDSYFNVRPKAKLEVRAIPEFKEKTAPGAYYQPSDLGGGRPGIFYVNVRDMDEITKIDMKTLAFHEGIPGHHFQIAITQESKSIPLFRRLVPYTAYAEGWAMYTEQLAREIGMYEKDPYSLLGSLDSELFRAVRLVVDTGIHFKKWSREEAIEYMMEHSISSKESIISEVERYFVMPGQACAYKIGMIKMLELRERMREAKGSNFDIKEFHNLVLLNGAMPLNILEDLIDTACM